MDKNNNQYCRFGFPIEISQKTQLKFEKVNTKNGSEQYKPVIVLQRNDTRLNKHQRIQLQGWRANCDIQPIIDYNACLEYLTKYASKGESLSSVARDAFVSVVNNAAATNSLSNRSLCQKLLIRSVGEREFSVQEEFMHNILSLKLLSSSYQVVSFSFRWK